MGFNTTLVTVYRRCLAFSAACKSVSIQPLLLFIEITRYPTEWCVRFQYNPCYCLSTQNSNTYLPMHSFNTTLVTVYLWMAFWPCMRIGSFNTTLVTVYQFLEIAGISTWKFQYNPCYCLSIKPDDKHMPEPLFQYNPCYCLSY